jgi:hypothetical protein
MNKPEEDLLLLFINKIQSIVYYCRVVWTEPCLDTQIYSSSSSSPSLITHFISVHFSSFEWTRYIRLPIEYYNHHSHWLTAAIRWYGKVRYTVLNMNMNKIYEMKGKFICFNNKKYALQLYAVAFFSPHTVHSVIYPGQKKKEIIIILSHLYSTLFFVFFFYSLSIINSSHYFHLFVIDDRRHGRYS